MWKAFFIPLFGLLTIPLIPAGDDWQFMKQTGFGELQEILMAKFSSRIKS
jgi:hypothetical protein